ncbi:hypothetical protein RIF29_18454 [Crotalaria pallida]|uniref:Uncharacterized protein n=1 Tax=Crotalaria pallida TaxID=3830 RepID=A0AAN9FQU4_CROPI
MIFTKAQCVAAIEESSDLPTKCFKHIGYRCMNALRGILSETTLSVGSDCCEILAEFDGQQFYYGGDEECSEVVHASLLDGSFMKHHCTNANDYEFEDQDDIVVFRRKLV